MESVNYKWRIISPMIGTFTIVRKLLKINEVHGLPLSILNLNLKMEIVISKDYAIHYMFRSKDTVDSKQNRTKTKESLFSSQ